MQVLLFAPQTSSLHSCWVEQACQLKTLMRPLHSRDESSPLCHLLAICTGLSRSCALSRDPTTVSVRPQWGRGLGASLGQGTRGWVQRREDPAALTAGRPDGSATSRPGTERAGQCQRLRVEVKAEWAQDAGLGSGRPECGRPPGEAPAPHVTAPQNRLRSLRPELLVCQALRAYVRPLRSDTHPPGRDAAAAWAPGAGSSDAEPSFPICRRDGHTRGPEGRRGGRPQAVSRGVDAAWWKRELAVASGSR